MIALPKNEESVIIYFFQTCIHVFVLLNIKKDILKTVLGAPLPSIVGERRTTKGNGDPKLIGLSHS